MGGVGHGALAGFVQHRIRVGQAKAEPVNRVRPVLHRRIQRRPQPRQRAHPHRQHIARHIAHDPGVAAVVITLPVGVQRQTRGLQIAVGNPGGLEVGQHLRELGRIGGHRRSGRGALAGDAKGDRGHVGGCVHPALAGDGDAGGISREGHPRKRNGKRNGKQ